jgi:hypothetical protein
MAVQKELLEGLAGKVELEDRERAFADGEDVAFPVSEPYSLCAYCKALPTDADGS